MNKFFPFKKSEAVQTTRPPISSDVEIKHIPIKRFFDIVFSLAILFFFFPLFLLVACAVWFSSPGKIIYAHERIGRGGKPFLCYKFRTMYVDADEKLKEILESDLEKKREWEATHKLKEDPRITPIGVFLRKTSLDELPQFVNVLRGHLSVVGPRAVSSIEIVKHFGPKASKILSIRPGVTGLWQTSGRNDTTYEKRLQLDEHYVDSRSFLMDLKLIAKTIPAMLFSRGAY